MDKKILTLFDNLSHDNVISFHINPEMNEDFLLSDEERKVVEDFLNNNVFDDDCFKKVFSEDVFVATAISICFFKFGVDKEKLPSIRYPFLKALATIVESLRMANAISEKAFSREMPSVVDELFKASFGRIFKTFDDVHELFFDGDELENRDDEEIGILLKDYVDDDFAFENLIELSNAMEKVNYSLFLNVDPSKQKEFSRVVRHFMKKAFVLLKTKFEIVRDDMEWIDSYIASDLENEIDLSPERLKEALLKVIDFGEKFNVVARMVFLTLWRITDEDEHFDLVDLFDEANRIFDRALGHLSVASRIYGFDYDYDFRFREESKYYKLYSYAYLGSFIGLQEKSPFANKEDEIRTISLALLHLTADAMDISFKVASKISRFVIFEKEFLEHHFAYIEGNINEKNVKYLQKTLDFLRKLEGEYSFTRTLACNSLFKEIILEDALEQKNYQLAKRIAYARYSNFFDIPTLFIVRKHNSKAYLSLLKRMTESGKNSHLKTLRENANMQKFYGSEFCDELKELCLRKDSDA